MIRSAPVIVTLAAVAIAVAVRAEPPRRVTHCQNQVACQAAAYQAPVATTAINAVVLVPSYFAAYTPGPSPEPPSPSPPSPTNPQTAPPTPSPAVPSPAAPAADRPLTDAEVLRALLEEIKALRADIRRIESAQGGASPADEKLSKQVGDIIGHSCVTCHGAAVAAKKGGELTLVNADGWVPNLDARNKARIVSRLSHREMPPATAEAKLQINDADRKLLIDWFSRP